MDYSVHSSITTSSHVDSSYDDMEAARLSQDYSSQLWCRRFERRKLIVNTTYKNFYMKIHLNLLIKWFILCVLSWLITFLLALDSYPTAHYGKKFIILWKWQLGLNKCPAPIVCSTKIYYHKIPPPQNPTSI